MEAKDTLMTFKEQTEEMKTAKVKPGCLVRKQAEITWDIAFKAGIDTLWKEIQKLGYQRVLDDLVIKGKLKEWGLK